MHNPFIALLLPLLGCHAMADYCTMDDGPLIDGFHRFNGSCTSFVECKSGAIDDVVKSCPPEMIFVVGSLVKKEGADFQPGACIVPTARFACTADSPTDHVVTSRQSPIKRAAAVVMSVVGKMMHLFDASTGTTADRRSKRNDPVYEAEEETELMATLLSTAMPISRAHRVANPVLLFVDGERVELQAIKVDIAMADGEGVIELTVANVKEMASNETTVEQPTQ